MNEESSVWFRNHFLIVAFSIKEISQFEAVAASFFHLRHLLDKIIPAAGTEWKRMWSWPGQLICKDKPASREHSEAVLKAGQEISCIIRGLYMNTLRLPPIVYHNIQTNPRNKLTGHLATGTPLKLLKLPLVGLYRRLYIYIKH